MISKLTLLASRLFVMDVRQCRDRSNPRQEPTRTPLLFSAMALFLPHRCQESTDLASGEALVVDINVGLAVIEACDQCRFRARCSATSESGQKRSRIDGGLSEVKRLLIGARRCGGETRKANRDRYIVPGGVQQWM